LVEDYKLENTYELHENINNKGMGVDGLNSFFQNNYKQTNTPNNSLSLLQVGKFVKIGKDEGIIDFVSNDGVTIYLSEGGTKKFTFSEFFRKFKDDNILIKEGSGFPSEFWSPEPELAPEPDYPEREVIELDPEEEEIQPEIQIDEDEGEVQIYEDDEDEGEVQEFEDTIRRIGPTTRPNIPNLPNTPRPNIRPTKNPNIRPFEPTIPKPKINPESLDIPSFYEEEEDIQPERTFTGTEDDPFGYNENIYINKTTYIKCQDCGQMVIDDFEGKISHIYNKHFYKPKMDGSVPVVVNSGRPVSWPSGGAVEQKLVNKYFINK